MNKILKFTFSSNDNQKKNKKSMSTEEYYNDEEFKKIIEGKDKLKIYEISNSAFKRIKMFKMTSIIFFLPMTLSIPIFNEYFIADLADSSIKFNFIYHLLFSLAGFCFGGSIIGIFGMRNIVILCNYLTKEKKFEMTKMTLSNRAYQTHLQDPDNLIRWNRNIFTPFLSIKNKKTQEKFSMTNLGEWPDKKVYHTILPTKKKISKNKKNDILDDVN